MKNALASALASKCGTRYFSWSIGMRLSSGDMNLRVSSSVDQITCFTPAAFGGVGDVLRLRLFLLAGEVLPEVGDAEHAVRAGERLLQALDVVQVGPDDFGASRGQCLRLVLARVARDRANGKAAVRVGEDRAGKSAALRPGCAADGDDFLVMPSS